MLEVLLTQMPYYVLALAAFTTALAAGLGAWTGARPRWFFLQAAGLGLVSGGLAIIVVTLGPEPFVEWRAARYVVRWLFLAGGLLWCVWCALYVPHIVRVRNGK